MNIEFHYYTVYLLALRAGFQDSDAETIACSSQFVDHNIISYRAKTDRGEYAIAPTQNYGFADEAYTREVYVPFHFLPGTVEEPRARRHDGASNYFNTTPNSPRAKELLVTALKTRNPYRIGIALHTYADTWAHQNFTGRLEPWNRVETNTPIPPIGHAQCLTRPDDSALRWDDKRLVPEHRRVDNRTRFTRAARQIYKYLCTYQRRPYTDLELIDWELDEIAGPRPSERSMKERIDELIIAGNMTPYSRTRWLTEALVLPDSENEELMFRGYSKVLWLRDAVLYRSRLAERRPVPAREGFYESDLYRWHEASRQHRDEALRLTADLPW